MRHDLSTAVVLAMGGLFPAMLSAASDPGGTFPAVLESTRQIPVVAEADVVVAGGSTAAVAAAIEAARGGASVFLAAPRHYLGDDMTGTLRVFLEPGETTKSPLAKRLFAQPKQANLGLPFTYKADRPAGAKHQDTNPPSRLTDGKWSDPVEHSVQYDEDVAITLDLHERCDLKSVRVMAFRSRDFGVASVSVQLSDNQRQWREAGMAKAGSTAKGDFMLTVPVADSARYVRCAIKKDPAATRILVGEIAVDSSKPAVVPLEDARHTTPLQVKRVLDQALTDAGVKFLYGCYAADLLQDDRGQPAGVVIVNRAGRQAVRAKVVIDATQPALLARAAGAEFRAAQPGPVPVRYLVIAQKPRPVTPEVSVRKLGLPIFAGFTRYRKGSLGTQGAAWYEYTLELDPADCGWPARAKIDQAVREAAYTEPQLYSADDPFFVYPQSIRAVRAADGQTAEPDAIALEAFRPAKVSRLWVLGPCVDAPRALAEKLLRPATWIEIGRRVGEAAAAEARGVSTGATVQVSRPGAVSSSTGEVRELLAGFRPIPTPQTVAQPAAALPVLGRYDVVVVGGGTAGAPAGIAAARQGAKTLVIEYQHGLGGVGTLGMIGGFWYGNRVGFTAEVPESPLELRMEFYRSELRKAGADVWLGTLGCGALADGNRVCGVVVATPYGRGVVLAKTVIDATGSADTAIAAGAEHVFVDDDFVLQASHIPSRNPGQSYLNGNCSPIDDADPRHVRSAIQIKLREVDRDFDLGQLIDTRERRRIVGDFCLDWLDVLNERTFPDSVVYACSNYDSHGYQVHPHFALARVDRKQKYWTYVPYRCLLPKGVEGILVVGIGISAHRDAMPIARMQPDQGNLGYAAGVAAAMASRDGITPRQVNVKTLQKHLVEIHNLPESVLSDRDSFPLPPDRIRAAIEAVVQNYRDVHVLLAQPTDSLPLLQAAYAKAAGRDKLIYAHVLAALGDATGLPALLEAVRPGGTAVNDLQPGGAGRLGMIRMIGYTRDPRAVPVLAEICCGRDTAADFQLVRSLAFALGRIADPSAAPALADLLRESKPRGRPSQTLMVACALYRCGDRDGVARQWLEQCAQQDDNTLARLAWQVLRSNR